MPDDGLVVGLEQRPECQGIWASRKHGAENFAHHHALHLVTCRVEVFHGCHCNLKK